MHEGTFSQWRRRLDKAQPGAKAQTGFAQVRLVEPPRERGGEAVLVELGGGVSVSVPVGTDALWLGRLLRSLRQD